MAQENSPNGMSSLNKDDAAKTTSIIPIGSSSKGTKPPQPQVLTAIYCEDVKIPAYPDEKNH